MAKTNELLEILALIPGSAHADIEKFLKISEISLGEPTRAESRLLESLSVTYAINVTKN